MDMKILQNYMIIFSMISKYHLPIKQSSCFNYLSLPKKSQNNQIKNLKAFSQLLKNKNFLHI